MCGIVGYTHQSRKLAPGILKAGIQVLVHRGPDQQGGFCSSSVSLGAARLRIVDLAGGDQPIRSADGDAVIAFNGEVYNHAELRAELEGGGVCFRTRCDTEVVLQAYLRWRAEAFGKLRGMFAVAIWIESEQKLVLARDRMGIKPLYYNVQAGELSFGSELKCIFANPDVPRRIDLAGLNCYLSLNYVPGPYTLVEGIQKLMPGCLLEWQKGAVRVDSYVPPQAENRTDCGKLTLDNACAQLDGLLSEAVKEQLVSDVPLGMWLSGGLDSSTVLDYAARLSPNRLKSFSVTFRGKSFDETRYVREVAQCYGTDHTEFDLSDEADLADTIAALPYYSDEPSADAGAVPVWYLAKMTHRDVTVVLSGEGADELFGGYLTYKADRYNRYFGRVPRGLRRAALALAREIPASDEKIGFEYKLQRFLEGSLLRPEAAHVFWNGTFTEEEKRRFFRYANAAPLNAILAQMRPAAKAGESFVERFLDFDRRYSMPDAILYKVDRMSMAHSVEVRPPFLDDRIVEFAGGLPERFKFAGGQTKFLLRRLMKDRLPQAVLKRPKVGFDIPIHEWFRGVLRPLLEDTLSEEALSATRLFDYRGVRQLMDEHFARKANWGYHLWGLVTLVPWMKQWNIEAPAMEPVAVTEQMQEPAVEELAWEPAAYSARTSEM